MSIIEIISKIHCTLGVYAIATSCPSIRFNQLSRHFDQEHSELDGKTITIRDSKLLLQTWTPFLPSLDGVPCLPKAVFPGTCLTKSVTLCPAQKRMEPEMFSSQQVGKKLRPQLARDWTEFASEGSSPTVTLDPLEGMEDDQPWFNALHPSWSALRDVSRPQEMHGTIYSQVVSPTIHYAVFAQRINESRRF